MTIAHEGSSGIETTGTAKGVSTTTVAYTNVAAGRLALLFCTIKLGSALFSTTPPTGWTLVIDTGSGGTGTSAADVGTTRLSVWYRVLDGSETGSVSIAAAGSESMAGGMSVYSSTLGTWERPIAVNGNDTGHGTNRSCACGAWGSALAAGDWVATAFASDTDTNPSITSPTITQTSATFGTVSTRNVRLSTSGNDTGLYTFDASVTTGNANAPTIGFTTSTSQCGPGAAIRLRESASRFPPVQIDSDLLGFDPNNPSGASQDSKTFTVAVGDRFTIGVNTEDDSYTEAITNIAGATATLGTWTRIVGTNTNSNSRVGYWSNTVTGAGTVAIRCTISGAAPATSWWGASIRQWRNCDGIGATFAGFVQSNPLDKQQDSSTVLVNVSDWNATNPGTPTWNGGLTTVTSGRDSGAAHYSWALAKLDDAGVPGRITYGLATPTFTQPALAMIEVLGSTTSTGQSVNVNRATETDVAQPIAKLKALALGRVSELAVARPITATRSYVVNRATETEVARAIARAKATAVNRAIETDAARSISAQRNYPVNRVTETESARTIIWTKSATVNRATETEASRPITSSKLLTTGRVTETDTARAITRVRSRSIGQVVETDTARAFAHYLSRTVGMATETDVARAMGSAASLAVGRATEANVARTIIWTKAKELNRATETDLARIVVASHVRAIGVATETDVARALAHTKLLAIGRAAETDDAQPVSFGGFNLLVSRVSEVDLARAITSRKASALNLVAETNVARLITPSHVRTVGRVATTDVARAVTALRSRALARVTDSSTARPIGSSHLKGISIAVETDVARALGLPFTTAVGRVAEFDLARAMSVSKTRSIGRATETDLARALVAVVATQLGRAVETDIARGLTKRILLGIVTEANIAGVITPVLGEGGAQKSPITIQHRSVNVLISSSSTGITLAEAMQLGIIVAGSGTGIVIAE